MSNLERVENIKQMVHKTQPDFDAIAKIHGAVNFKREATFALQVLSSNDYMMGVAVSNPDSLKFAVMNVAAVGLSLDPVRRLAYLIPRKKKICLDVSYMGYVELAVQVGAIKWCLAEVVRENDVFKLGAMGSAPVHEFSPFDGAEKRGEIIGAYAVAKTHDGEHIVTHLSIEKIAKSRAASESYQAHLKDKGKSSPWVTDTEEMVKKTVIRRAYKSWPKSSTKDDRFEKAIEVSSQIDFEVEEQPAIGAPAEDPSLKKIEEIKKSIVALGRTEEQLLTHLARVVKRKLTSLADLTEIELGQSIVMLNQWLENKKQKDAVHENAG